MIDHAARLHAAAHSDPPPAARHQTVMLEASLYIRELEDRIVALRTGFALVIEQAAEMVGRSASERQ